jgi:RHS repeat-associated protein
MKNTFSCRQFKAILNGLGMLLILICFAGVGRTQNILPDGLDAASASVTVTKPSPTKPDLFDKNIDLYSGSLKLNVPLLNISGRGSTAINVGLTIQPQNISGVGTYPGVLTDFSSIPILNLFESPTPQKAYYEKLARFGSLYGPGVVFAYWQSFNYPVNAQGASVNWSGVGRRPGQLIFIDATGKQITLRDQELVREARYCGGSGNTYFGNAYQYRTIADAGKVYRSVEDNGTVFVADTILSVPSASGEVDDLYNAQDIPILPTGYLYLRDGTRMRVIGGYIRWARDKNGNTIFYDYEAVPGGFSGLSPLLRVSQIQDSLNRIVTIQYGSYTTPDVISFAGVGNISRTVRVQRKLLENALQAGDTAKLLRNLYPNEHWQLDHFPSVQGAKYNPEIISSVEFTDGRVLSFEYDSYGEVAWIRKPEGSATHFKYSAGAKNSDIGGAENYQFGYVEVDGQGNQHGYTRDTWLYYRRLTEVTEYIDSTTVTQKMTISRPEVPGNADPSGSVRVNTYDPAGNLLTANLHYFYNLYKRQHFLSTGTPCSTLARWNSGLEYKAETFDIVNNAPILAKTEEKVWTHGPFNGAMPGVGDYAWWDGNVDNIWLPDRPRVLTERTTLADSGLLLEKNYQYDQYLNPIDVSEYDYGTNNTRGPLLRRTHTTYVVDLNGVPYPGTGLYMSSLPSTTLVYNGTDPDPISRTDYEYDNYVSDNGHAPLSPETNIINNCIHYNDVKQCVAPSTPSFIFRGNPTSVTTYLNPVSLAGAVKTYTRYDVAGNVIGTTDPNGNVTQNDFTDAFSDGVNRYTYAFVSGVTSPVPDSTGVKGSSMSLLSHSTYDFSSGLVVSSTDANNHTSTNFYSAPDGTVDPLNRLRKVVNPEGGWTTFDYNDVAGNIFVHTQTLWQSTPTQRILDSYQYFDNYRRPTRVFTYDGSAPDRAWSVSDTQYDALGRVVRVSNPYFTSGPSGVIEPGRPGSVTEYDGLGRVHRLITPDSGMVVTAYFGNRVMATDQARHSRRNDLDGLGRLIQVVEYNRLLANSNVIEEPVTGDYTTTYQYDAQDNLRKVIQANQTREFTYDAFKRLVSATNPENGTCLFEYDNNSNLKARTDARSVKTSYTYDALNRLVQRTYSVTGAPPNYIPSPQVDYFYDGKGMPSGVPTPTSALGQTTAVKSSVAESITAGFDVMGRVTSQLQVVDPQSTDDRKTYSMAYTYDLAGGLVTETYPSGKVIATEYDNASRVAGVRRQNGNYYVGGGANGMQYTAFGALEAIKLGNGLWEHREYNIRQQPTRIALGTSTTDASVLNLTYTYGTVINGSLDVTWNNGNPQSQSITAPGPSLTQKYEYDPLNRLRKAQELNGATANWTQVFRFDVFGNRNYDTGTSSNQLVSPVSDPVIDPNTNRIDSTISGQTNVHYDGAGNLTRDVAGSNFSFDAENHQVLYNDGNLAAGGAIYSYDADGRRVKKVTANGTTVFVYDALGQMIAEYNDESQQHANGTNYVTTDVLGSTRVVTNSNGIASRHDYYPYGEEISRTGSGYGGTDSVKQKFTGKERDSETGLDFFQARYYSSASGRFTSPDEFGGGATEYFAQAASANPTFYGDPANPQTLNKYQYGLNNPLRYVDPSGHFGLDEFWSSIDSLVKQGQDELNSVFRGLTNADPLDNLNMQRAQGALDQYPDGKPNRVFGFTGPDVNLILQSYTDARTNMVFISSVGLALQEFALIGASLVDSAPTMSTNIGLRTPRVPPAEPPLAPSTSNPAPVEDALPELEISASKYPQLAENISHAQRAGHPDVLTFGGNNDANRGAATKNIPILQGYDRDEYPFASTMEGGSGAWVGYVPRDQNRAQGYLMKNLIQRNNLVPGDKFRVIIGR